MVGWTHEDPPWTVGGTTVVVLGGGMFATGGTISKFFPILETIPPADDGTYDGECPLGVDTIGEVETDGEF